MYLDGAKLVCINEKGEPGAIVQAKGRQFTFGYYMSCNVVLQHPKALSVHCEIKCDAFGKITIHNMSDKHPVSLNGNAVKVMRPLLTGSKITILDKDYMWYFPRKTSNEVKDSSEETATTPQKAATIAEQPPNSCPDLRFHRVLQKRLTVHNFAYCIQSDEEGNISMDSDIGSNAQSTDEEYSPILISSGNNSVTGKDMPLLSPAMEEAGQEQRNMTSSDKSVVLIDLNDTPNMNIINCTKNKENTSSAPRNIENLSLCQSDMVITSFSPRETGVRIEKSFTAILKPTTHRNVNNRGNDGSQNFIDFTTPTIKKKSSDSSMHLIDLTTPGRTKHNTAANICPKSSGKPTPKKNSEKGQNLKSNESDVIFVGTPVEDVNKIDTLKSVISVNSTDSSGVAELSDSFSPSYATALAIPHETATFNSTPKKGFTPKTPKRTPQSLMKRALLASAKKQGITPTTNIQSKSSIRSQDQSDLCTPPASSRKIQFMAQRHSMSTPPRRSATRLKLDGTPCGVSSVSQARRALCNNSEGKPTTSTPFVKSSLLQRGASTATFKVRKSIGGTLTSHISKIRKSLALSMKTDATAATTSGSVRSNYIPSPSRARARAIVASIIKSPQNLNKKKTEPQTAVMNVNAPTAEDSDQTSDLNRTFILDSQIEESARDTSLLPVADTAAISKTVEEEANLNVLSSTEKVSSVHDTQNSSSEKDLQEQSLAGLDDDRNSNDLYADNQCSEVKCHTESLKGDEASSIVLCNVVDTQQCTETALRTCLTKEANESIETEKTTVEETTEKGLKDDLLEQIEDVLNKSDELEKSKNPTKKDEVDEDVFKLSEESDDTEVVHNSHKLETQKVPQNATKEDKEEEDAVKLLEESDYNEEVVRNSHELETQRLSDIAEEIIKSSPPIPNPTINEGNEAIVKRIGPSSSKKMSIVADVLLPKPPNLLDLKEMLETPKKQKELNMSVRPTKPQQHPPKVTDVDEQHLDGISDLLATPASDFVPEENKDSIKRSKTKLSHQSSFIPRRSARRASMSAAACIALTPKTISKRKSICIESEVGLLTAVTPKQRVIVDDALDDMNILEEISSSPSLETETENVFKRRFITDGDFCSALQNVPESDDSNLHAENVNTDAELSKDVNLNNQNNEENEAECKIVDISEYDYGKEIKETNNDSKNTAAVVSKIPKISSKKRNEKVNVTLDEVQPQQKRKSQLKETEEELVTETETETGRQLDCEKPMTSSQAKKNLNRLEMKTPTSCSDSPVTGTKEQRCSTPIMDGNKSPTNTSSASRVSKFLIESGLLPNQENLNPSMTTDQDQSEDEEEGEGFDKFFRTPRAKDVMVPTSPKSLDLKKSVNSVESETSSDYGLDSTNLSLGDMLKTPVATGFADYIPNSNESEGVAAEGNEEDETVRNLTAEEVFERLVGETTVTKTPKQQVYSNLRKRMPNSPSVVKSPFSATDIITDLPKSDIQEWVDSIENVDVPEDLLNTLNNDNDLSRDPLSLSTTMLSAGSVSKINAITSVESIIDNSEIAELAVSASVAQPLTPSSVQKMTKQKSATSLGNEDECRNTKGNSTDNVADMSGIDMLEQSEDSLDSDHMLANDSEANIENTSEKDNCNTKSDDQMKMNQVDEFRNAAQNSTTPDICKPVSELSRRSMGLREEDAVAIDFEKENVRRSKEKEGDKVGNNVETKATSHFSKPCETAVISEVSSKADDYNEEIISDNQMPCKDKVQLSEDNADNAIEVDPRVASDEVVKANVSNSVNDHAKQAATAANKTQFTAIDKHSEFSEYLLEKNNGKSSDKNLLLRKTSLDISIDSFKDSLSVVLCKPDEIAQEDIDKSKSEVKLPGSSQAISESKNSKPNVSIESSENVEAVTFGVFSETECEQLKSVITETDPTVEIEKEDAAIHDADGNNGNIENSSHIDLPKLCAENLLELDDPVDGRTTTPTASVQTSPSISTNAASIQLEEGLDKGEHSKGKKHTETVKFERVVDAEIVIDVEIGVHNTSGRSKSNRVSCEPLKEATCEHMESADEELKVVDISKVRQGVDKDDIKEDPKGDESQTRHNRKLVDEAEQSTELAKGTPVRGAGHRSKLVKANTEDNDTIEKLAESDLDLDTNTRREMETGVVIKEANTQPMVAEAEPRPEEPHAPVLPEYVSDSLKTSRGRTRKPTARAQQFLEEERAKASTPKKKLMLALSGSPATPTKAISLRARKQSTIDADSICGTTPQRSAKRETRGRKIASAAVTEMNEKPKHNLHSSNALKAEQERNSSDDSEEDDTPLNRLHGGQVSLKLSASSNLRSETETSLWVSPTPTPKRVYRGRKVLIPETSKRFDAEHSSNQSTTLLNDKEKPTSDGLHDTVNEGDKSNQLLISSTPLKVSARLRQKTSIAEKVNLTITPKKTAAEQGRERKPRRKPTSESNSEMEVDNLELEATKQIEDKPQKLPARRGRKASTIENETLISSLSKPIVKRGTRRQKLAADTTSEASHSELEHCTTQETTVSEENGKTGRARRRAPKNAAQNKDTSAEVDLSDGVHIVHLPVAVEKKPARRGRKVSTNDKEIEPSSTSQEELPTKRPVRKRKAAVKDEENTDRPEEMAVDGGTTTLADVPNTTKGRTRKQNTAEKNSQPDTDDIVIVEPAQKKVARAAAKKSAQVSAAISTRRGRNAVTPIEEEHMEEIAEESDDPDEYKPKTTRRRLGKVICKLEQATGAPKGKTTASTLQEETDNQTDNKEEKDKPKLTRSRRGGLTSKLQKQVEDSAGDSCDEETHVGDAPEEKELPKKSVATRSRRERAAAKSNLQHIEVEEKQRQKVKSVSAIKSHSNDDNKVDKEIPETSEQSREPSISSVSPPPAAVKRGAKKPDKSAEITSPAPKRGRRKPTTTTTEKAEIAIRGGSRSRKVTFQSPAVKFEYHVTADEPPKRVTRTTRRK